MKIKVRKNLEVLGYSKFKLTSSDGKKLESVSFMDERQVLSDNNGMTLPYYSIRHLSRDHYVVLDVADVVDCEKDVYYEGVPVLKKSTDDSVKLKYGIIKINRDKQGNIIPFAEEKVFPCICDSIIDGCCETAILKDDKGRYHYLDLDFTSKNYGRTLVTSLKSAKPFDDRLFAECSFSGKYYKGYFPREVKRASVSSNSDLLSLKEVRYLTGEDNTLTSEEKIIVETKSSILRGDIVVDKKTLSKSIYK